nr:hypothetical protein [Ochrobactrum sp. UNC390CL2Tsu3S39]
MALVDRLSKLDAPDREGDEEIHDLLCDGKFFSQLADAPLGQGCWMYNFPNGDVSSALYVTSSVDAAIALAERVLPGWVPSVGQNVHHRYWHATISTAIDGEIVGHSADHPSAGAIALCIALLRAKEAARG